MLTGPEAAEQSPENAEQSADKARTFGDGRGRQSTRDSISGSTATYLLPIRLHEPADADLTEYLRDISRYCRVIIVDGSAPNVFRVSHELWSGFALHIPPANDLRCANGKVHGVLTGLRLVETPLLVIADDDVRYTVEGLRQCVAQFEGLGDADLIRPQNYFEPLPWHGRWDTARILLNRATGGDFPGTLLVRTEVLRAAGGYDGDVLFENLELMRTVASAGGSCVSRPDLYVRRVPPTTEHFLGQRVRQAYDEFARPLRMLFALSLLPTIILLFVYRRPRAVVIAAIGVITLAEAGRRRDGGRVWFPATSSLLAPLWLVERAVCAWCAVGLRLTGGVRYGSGKLLHAATPLRRLRTRSHSCPNE